MAAYNDDDKRYIQTAKDKGATHVIVFDDTFDSDDDSCYPVYVMPGDDIAKKKAAHRDNGSIVVKTIDVSQVTDAV